MPTPTTTTSSTFRAISTTESGTTTSTGTPTAPDVARRMTMAVQVTIPQGMRCFCDGEKVVEARGETVGAVLAHLENLYPALVTRLLDGEGRPNCFVKIFVGEVEIGALDGLATPARNDVRIHVLAGVAGG